MSIGFAGRTVWTNRVSGLEVDANLWYHWLSSTKDLHRSERERTKITNCFSWIWLWRCSCHVCIFGDFEGILVEKNKKYRMQEKFSDSLNSRAECNQLQPHRCISDNHFQRFWQASSTLGKICSEQFNIPRNFVIFSRSSEFLWKSNTKFNCSTV